VRKLSAAFRAAIVRCERRSLALGLREFPAGSCSDASLLLAQFLEDSGFQGATYVAGLRDRYSHAWLELEDLIIDITVDQFAADPEAVLILGGIPATDDGFWLPRIGTGILSSKRHDGPQRGLMTTTRGLRGF
jgi:hypothetical protein